MSTRTSGNAFPLGPSDGSKIGIERTVSASLTPGPFFPSAYPKLQPGESLGEDRNGGERSEDVKRLGVKGGRIFPPSVGLCPHCPSGQHFSLAFLLFHGACHGPDITVPDA